jgi:hypothetical protein
VSDNCFKFSRAMKELVEKSCQGLKRP